MQATQLIPTRAATGGQSISLATPAVQLLGAAILALMVVFMIGFSQIMPVHNAAHDVRHSASFPCH
jgi:cobalt transporter subunit CbtB